MRDKCNSDSKDNIGLTLPMSISQSVDLKTNSVSSQNEKQSDLQETPYFDRLESYCDTELFKNQIEFQNSISVRPSQLDQQWSLSQKLDFQQWSVQNKQEEEILPSCKAQSEVAFKDQDLNQKKQKRVDQDEMTTSFFKPEVLHPTIQRPIIKKVKDKKEYIIELKEIKRTGNSNKRSHEDTERQVQIRDKAIILIGVSKDNDYLINDCMSSISKKHAALKFDENKAIWYIIDQNSKNGTYQIKNEIILSPQIQLLIGTFLCEVKDIILDEQKQIDETLPSFKLEFEFIKGGQVQHIGKRYQKQLKEDVFINDLHCSIQTNNNFDIMLINQNDIYDQVGVKLVSNVPFELKELSIIKFGFLNKYQIQILNNKCIETTFSQCSKEQSQQNEIGNKCLMCKQSDQKLFFLKPCNHQVLCLECILNKSKEQCPSCKNTFIDFTYSSAD